MIIIIIIVSLIIFISLPLPLQIILFAVNFFLPDPIPIFDEVIMIASIINKVKSMTAVFDFYERHKIIVFFLIALILTGIVMLIVTTGTSLLG